MRFGPKWISTCVTILVLSTSVPAAAQWNTSVSRDEVTGEKQCYAHSPATGPTQKMDFPYDDITAWLGVGTDGKHEWAYIGFSKSPNFAADETKDGYNLICTRVKWDDTVQDVTFTHDWGSKFIQFRVLVPFYDEVIPKISAANNVLVELNWYGEGRTYFKFSLRGSSAAISKMRSTCDGN